MLLTDLAEKISRPVLASTDDYVGASAKFQLLIRPHQRAAFCRFWKSPQGFAARANFAFHRDCFLVRRRLPREWCPCGETQIKILTDVSR